MKCELCHKRDAETAIEREVNGRKRELYVCKACALREKRPVAQKILVGGGADSSSNFLGMMLGEAFEMIDTVLRDGQRPPIDPACPACGLTRNEWKRRGQLGCPQCWQAFRADLETWLRQDQAGLRHVGKAPRKHRLEAQRLALQKQLDAAVAAQRYEEAIVLREKLAKLPPAGEAHP